MHLIPLLLDVSGGEILFLLKRSMELRIRLFFFLHSIVTRFGGVFNCMLFLIIFQQHLIINGLNATGRNRIMQLQLEAFDCDALPELLALHREL